MTSTARRRPIRQAASSSRLRSTRPAIRKYHLLTRLGVLDDIDWIPTGAIYEVRGGPVGEPFVLPESFAPARHALLERFPSAAAGISSALGEMERIATGLGTLSKGRQAFRNPMKGLLALAEARSGGERLAPFGRRAV